MNIRHHCTLTMCSYMILCISFLLLSNNVNAQTFTIDIYKLPLNTKKSEFAPAFYKNGVAYVGSGGKSEYKRASSNRKADQYDVFYVLRNANGEWQEPKKFGPKVNTEFDETSIIFYDKGRSFMITRNNISDDQRNKLIEKKASKGLFSNLNKDKKKELKDNKLVTKLSIAGGRVSNSIGNVSQIEDLEINSLDYAVSDPAISPDKKILIVSSDKPGGQGKNDLYMFKRINGAWANMTPLSNLINSPEDEITPFILDEYTMFFASDKPGGNGKLDVYRVDGWNTIKPNVKLLPYPINTEADDFGLIMAPTRRSGYLASNRPASVGGIDVFLFNQKARTLDIVLVDANEKPLANKKVTLKLGSDKIIGEYYTTKRGKIKIDVNKKADYTFSYVSPKKTFYLNWLGTEKSISKRFVIDDVDIEKETNEEKDPLLAAMNQKNKMKEQIKSSAERFNKNEKNKNIVTNNINNNQESTLLTPINNENFQEIGDPNKNSSKVTKEQEKEMLAMVQSKQKVSVAIPKEKINARSTTKKKIISKLKEPKKITAKKEEKVEKKEMTTKTRTGILSKLTKESINLKEQVLLEGKISTSKNNPLAYAKVLIETDDINPKQITVKTDNVGIYGTNIERFKKYWVTVLHENEYSIPTYVDASAADDPKIFVRSTSVKLNINDKVPLRNMNYKISKLNIKRGGNVELRALARFLNLESNISFNVEINSYTDATGPEWLNLKLSQQRADKAKAYLIQVGVDESRIEANGKGETNFLNQCVNNVPCSLKLHAINRRTEIILK